MDRTNVKGGSCWRCWLLEVAASAVAIVPAEVPAVWVALAAMETRVASVIRLGDALSTQ